MFPTQGFNQFWKHPPNSQCRTLPWKPSKQTWDFRSLSLNITSLLKSCSVPTETFPLKFLWLPKVFQALASQFGERNKWFQTLRVKRQFLGPRTTQNSLRCTKSLDTTPGSLRLSKTLGTSVATPARVRGTLRNFSRGNWVCHPPQGYSCLREGGYIPSEPGMAGDNS